MAIFKNQLNLCALLASATMLLASCQRGENIPTKDILVNRSAEITEPAAERRFRAHLVEFTSEGYEPYKNKVSSIDVGVLENRSDRGVECELLAPQASTRAAKQPWAPQDLYTNVVSEQEKTEHPDRQGEKDIFFTGDDNNRNGTKQSYQSTMIPETMLANSMDFENKKIEKSEFTFSFRFTRKGILVERRMKLKVKPTGSTCVAGAYICANNDNSCTDWRLLHKVVVHVDVKGGIKDRVRPPASDRERNDIKKVVLQESALDKDEKPTTSISEVIEKP